MRDNSRGTYHSGRARLLYSNSNMLKNLKKTKKQQQNNTHVQVIFGTSIIFILFFAKILYVSFQIIADEVPNSNMHNTDLHQTDFFNL